MFYYLFFICSGLIGFEPLATVNPPGGLDEDD